MKKFLASLLKLLKVVIVIVLICLAIYLLFATGGTVAAVFPILADTAIGALTTGVAAALCIGVAYIVDPATTTEAMQAVGEGLADAARTVLDELTDIAKDVIPWWVWAAGAAFLFFAFGGGKDRQKPAGSPESTDALLLAAPGEDEPDQEGGPVLSDGAASEEALLLTGGRAF